MSQEKCKWCVVVLCSKEASNGSSLVVSFSFFFAFWGSKEGASSCSQCPHESLACHKYNDQCYEAAINEQIKLVSHFVFHNCNIYKIIVEWLSYSLLYTNHYSRWKWNCTLSCFVMDIFISFFCLMKPILDCNVYIGFPFFLYFFGLIYHAIGCGYVSFLKKVSYSSFEMSSIPL